MNTNKHSKFKIIRNICIFIILAIVLFFAVNIIYLYAAYERIPDRQTTKIEPAKNTTSASKKYLQNGVNYTALTYNTGFSAYTPNFTFFMDGGSESWAFSEQSVIEDTTKIADLLSSIEPDFIALQEVDSNSTRTYNIDETQMYRDALTNYYSTTTRCFDSPFLFWPPLQPHGMSVSNLMTLSKFISINSLRRQLPIDEGPTAILDYDRCYSIDRYETDNGKELVWYTTHMSAYAKDPTTSNKQIEMLISDMQHEFDMGNYVICGADFNKQIVPNPENYFKQELIKETNPFPYEYLKDTDISVISGFDANIPVGTCRDAGVVVNPNMQVSNIDGFLVSSNIKVLKQEIINTNFEYSDHNPVFMTFRLL